MLNFAEIQRGLRLVVPAQFGLSVSRQLGRFQARSNVVGQMRRLAVCATALKSPKCSPLTVRSASVALAAELRVVEGSRTASENARLPVTLRACIAQAFDIRNIDSASVRIHLELPRVQIVGARGRNRARRRCSSSPKQAASPARRSFPGREPASAARRTVCRYPTAPSRCHSASRAGRPPPSARSAVPVIGSFSAESGARSSAFTPLACRFACSSGMRIEQRLAR